jgi:hypothetical protein
LSMYQAHQGEKGNEKADELAKEAAVTGLRVEAEIPKAFTRRLCRERSWQLWSEQWEALGNGDGMGGGRNKVYLQFMPTLESIKDKLWRRNQGRRRVFQLLSGHCHVGAYLARVRKREDGRCEYCGVEEEDVRHYLLRCPRWYRQRREIEDLVVRGDPVASMGNIFGEIERLERYIKQTGRLEF